MPEKIVSDFIQANGRLSYKRLQNYAEMASVEEFASIFKRPILVGSSVYEGELVKSNFAEFDQTMMFSAASVHEDSGEEDDGECLQFAIFALFKKNRGDGKPNIVSIGRSSENDVVMNDYPISRSHGYIRIQGRQFFLRDLGTTNGTFINENLLQPKKEYELFIDDIVGFGRYRFHFMDARDFYQRIQK